MSNNNERLRFEDSGQLNALLADVAGGNGSAFETLYQATSSKLFGVCLRMLPDRADAEEVLQEAYTTVWRKAGHFDATRASAITWLVSIARNKAIDRLRTMPAIGRQSSIDIAESIADPAASPVETAEAASDGARLDGCMEQLDDRRRQLIRTAFFDGATYEELSQRTGSPLGSVKSWIRRGLAQLRACLEA